MDLIAYLEGRSGTKLIEWGYFLLDVPENLPLDCKNHIVNTSIASLEAIPDDKFDSSEWQKLYHQIPTVDRIFGKKSLELLEAVNDKVISTKEM
jgi:hypothetical protein